MNSGDSMSILLVDDNAGDRLLIRMAFQGDPALAGLPLHEAANGRACLDLLARPDENPIGGRPALVLLDLNMPGLSGFEVLDRLQADADTRSVPVIVLTSSDQDGDIATSLDHGAVEVLCKPLDPDRLKRALRRLGGDWRHRLDPAP